MELNLCFNCMKEKPEPGSCPHCGFDESDYEAASYHIPPGTILYGKYMIGRTLGEGGFGITYVGWDLNLEMKVAVKEYYPNGYVTRNNRRTNTLSILSGPRGEFFQKGVEKFVDEARRLAKFWKLPGIVSVKDYFQENNTAYIVMEFIQGSTLKELLKQRPDKRLPAAEVFVMMRPVMKSLDKVHQAGLIHRDISPDNLMVDQEGEVKLIDFGAARDFLADGEKSLSVMLKPGYSPEEQYRSRGKQGPWTDVYSLCATIYRAITGQVPEESLERMTEDTLKRPSQLGVSLPRWQEEALMKGLAVIQKDRQQSMKELEAALYTEPEETKNLEAKLSITPAERKKIEESEKSQEKTGEIEAAGKEGEAAKPREQDGERESGDGSRQKKQAADPSRKKRRGPVIGGAAILLAILMICILLPREEQDSGKKETQMQTEDAELAVSPEATNQEPTQSASQEHTPEASPEITQTASLESTQVASPEPTQAASQEPTQGASQEPTQAANRDLNMDMNEPVVWTDSNMERFIRQGLEKPEGDILVGDLADIRVLRIHNIDVALYESVEEDEGTLYGSHYKDVKDEGAITSLEDLKYFPNLTILQVSRHTVVDISALSGLSSLTDLDLSGNDLTNISALSDLTGLTSLNLYSNDLTNISALSDLTSLTSLNLSSNELTDISALSGLTGLASLDLGSLDLGSNELTDISELSGLTGLTKLNLWSNKLIDISALSGLTGLISLDLGFNNLTDISALSGLTGLTSLDLGFNNLTDISVLSSLSGLASLDLGSNELTDISALPGLTGLTSLDLDGNNLIDISELSGLISLTSLDLGDNDLTDISALSGLVSLTYLYLCGNDLTDISELSGLTGLTKLDLSRNGLTDISELSGLTGLTSLDLSRNDLTDISALSGLTALTHLDLSGNELTDISALSNLTSLENLDLGRNKRLSSLEPLSQLSNLELLKLDSKWENNHSCLDGIEDLKIGYSF